MEDEKLISLLEAMETRLKTDWKTELGTVEVRLKSELKSEMESVEVRLKAELKAEINNEREFLVRALDRIESNLDHKLVDLKEEIQQKESRTDRRFDQINVRQKRVDTIWKVALDWGREADTMDSARDQLIADLRHDLTDLRKRVEAIEHRQA